MPISVDHDARRREVAEIAARLVARFGVEGVSIRDVAQAAGCSTTIVSHYFKNKRELLLFTFREAAQRSVARVAALPKQASLQAHLELLLPLTDALRSDWKVWIAFWSWVETDREFAREQVKRARLARELIQRLLNDQKEQGLLDSAVDSDFEARRLLTAVVGISTQGIFDPKEWSPKRQRALLAAEIAAIPGTRGG
ncbi:MAG TPA: TetR/AcrR family transcriptional regulator [Stellaceae bacterium]|nr:TetR/AcrR family transcriptional regulator [Stellaceae bacterium]